MKVSIITVSYNSEKFIQYCIDSVLNQSYSQIEHIIIDGNSIDDTLNIVKGYPHLKWLSESDKGIYDAINKGINLSKGNIIGILNSDDFFSDDDVIARVVKSFEENEQLEAVYSDVNFVKRVDEKEFVRHYSSKYFKPWMFRFGFQPAHPTFYVKREIFQKYGLYRTDLKIAGDFELLARFLLKKKIKFRYVSDQWVKMRIGGTSTSGLKSVIKINKEVMKALKENEIYSNLIFVYARYLFKWWGFVKKY